MGVSEVYTCTAWYTLSSGQEEAPYCLLLAAVLTKDFATLEYIRSPGFRVSKKSGLLGIQPNHCISSILDASTDAFGAIGTDLEAIRVAIYAKEVWAGLGVSEVGGTKVADIVFYEVSVSHVN